METQTRPRDRWLYVGKFEPSFYADDSNPASNEFVIQLADWDRMTADLLSQVVKASGSIRNASKAVGVPKSTLATMIQRLRANGVWPD